MAAPSQGSVSALFALIPVSPASHMYVYPYQDIQEGTAGVHASVAAASVPIPECPPSHQGWLNVPQTWAFLLAIQSVPQPGLAPSTSCSGLTQMSLFIHSWFSKCGEKMFWCKTVIYYSKNNE